MKLTKSQLKEAIAKGLEREPELTDYEEDDLATDQQMIILLQNILAQLKTLIQVATPAKDPFASALEKTAAQYTVAEGKKLTKSQLKQIIKEELGNLNEAGEELAARSWEIQARNLDLKDARPSYLERNPKDEEKVKGALEKALELVQHAELKGYNPQAMAKEMWTAIARAFGSHWANETLKGYYTPPAFGSEEHSAAWEPPALEENKMKLTKSQLKHIIKEALDVPGLKGHWESSEKLDPPFRTSTRPIDQEVLAVAKTILDGPHREKLAQLAQVKADPEKFTMTVHALVSRMGSHADPEQVKDEILRRLGVGQ